MRNNKPKNELGVSLSGGGYRATAFHLGTLKKLEELGILKQVNVLSTISGGSITGAAWCLHEGDFASFYHKIMEALRTKDVIRYVYRSWPFIRTILLIVMLLFGAAVLTFTPWAKWSFPSLILLFFLLMKYQYKIFPVSKVIEKAYIKFFFGQTTLKDLLTKHTIAIGSSNLHTGRPFTFSQYKMSDSTYTDKEAYDPPIGFRHLDFPVARAVMASTCVPFAFSPVKIDRKFFINPKDDDRIRPALVDGGVYDNQGIHKLTQPRSSYECRVIITSDAGGNYIAEKKYPNVIALLMRTVDLFMYRIKTTQLIQNVYRNVETTDRPIAYFSLGWRLQKAIPGFYRNLKDGQVSTEVLKHHRIRAEWLDNPAMHEHEIISFMEQKVRYNEILKRDLHDDEWQLARATTTNLTCLSEKRIEYLVRHAENMTELWIRLYCPHLVRDNA